MGIPPAEGHRLTFGATAADVAQIAQRQTFPSELVVSNDIRTAPVKPCAYIVRVDDKNDNVYAAAISFPS